MPHASANEAGSPSSRPASYARHAALLACLVALGVSWGLRVVHRGPYFPGFEVLGAAEGLWLVSTRTPAEIWQWVLEHRTSNVTWSIASVPFVLFPGWLASQWPWVGWPHVVTFGSVCASLALLVRALPRTPAWVVLLAFGASAALMSFSVTGFAYVSSTLPYALAFWIVMRWRQRALATALWCLLVVELGRHTQELGRTVFSVFLVAALTLRDVPWRTRLVWLAAVAGQLFVIGTRPTGDIGHHAALALAPVAEWPGRLLDLARRMLLGTTIDLPGLWLAGMASVVLVRRDRAFWCIVLVGQAALLVTLALGTGVNQGVDGVWPRRTLLASFCCVAAAAAVVGEGRRASAWLLALLVAGHAAQLVQTIRWSRTPLYAASDGGWTFTLPAVRTTLDYQTPLFVVDWAEDLRRRLDRGERAILLYNGGAYEENATNPTGVLERLYLHLGHARFMERVYVFSAVTRRWNRLPVRPLEDLPAFVDGLAAADPATLTRWHVHDLTVANDARDWPPIVRRRDEAAAIRTALERRFVLVAEATTDDGFERRSARWGLALQPTPR